MRRYGTSYVLKELKTQTIARYHCTPMGTAHIQDTAAPMLARTRDSGHLLTTYLARLCGSFTQNSAHPNILSNNHTPWYLHKQAEDLRLHAH